MRPGNVLTRILFAGAAVLAVCAVLAAFASGSLQSRAEGAGAVTQSHADDVPLALGDFTPTPDPSPEPTPDPSPEPESTPDDNCCGAPDFEPTAEPTEAAPTEEPEPTTPPAATATPSGGAGAGGIGPPDTGTGPSAGTGSLMLVATLLAIAAAVLGGAGVLLAGRAD